MSWDSMQGILMILLFVGLFFFMMRGCAGMGRGGGGGCGAGRGSGNDRAPANGKPNDNSELRKGGV